MPYKSKPGARKYGDNPLKDKGYTPFKMKGHTLPGINQKLDDHPKVAEQGLSGSSPFQHTEGKKHRNPHKVETTMDSKTGNIRKTDTTTGKTAVWKKGKTSKQTGITEYIGPKGDKSYMDVKESPAKHMVTLASDPPKYKQHSHGEDGKITYTGKTPRNKSDNHIGGSKRKLPSREEVKNYLKKQKKVKTKHKDLTPNELAPSSPAKTHKPGHKKGMSAVDFDDTVARENLLKQGFTQRDADKMIKSGAVTGRIGNQSKKDIETYDQMLNRLSKKYKKSPKNLKKILKSKKYKEGRKSM
jgi:hypothetical protein